MNALVRTSSIKLQKNFNVEILSKNTEQINVRFLVYNTIIKYECVVVIFLSSNIKLRGSYLTSSHFQTNFARIKITFQAVEQYVPSALFFSSLFSLFMALNTPKALFVYRVKIGMCTVKTVNFVCC